MARLVSCLAMLSWAHTAQADPATYTLDPSASQLTVQVFKDASGLSDFAHDHVILATGWTGSATLDVDDGGTVSSCSIQVQVPVSGLQVDIPALRAAFSMGIMLTDAQRTQVGEHMRSEEQIDEANHSTITFSASSCSGSLSAMQVDGSMSIRGRSTAVSFTLAGSITDGTLEGSGGFSLNHSDFGFAPYSAFLGQLRNKQELRFAVKVSGTAQ